MSESAENNGSVKSHREQAPQDTGILKSLMGMVKKRVKNALGKAFPILGALFLNSPAHAENDHYPPQVVAEEHESGLHAEDHRAPEHHEIESSLALKVASETGSDAGRYIALLPEHRKKLQLDHPERTGQVVEVKTVSGESLGLFMVGAGHKDLDKGQCAARGIPLNTEITVHKPSDIEQITSELKTAFNIDMPSGLYVKEHAEWEQKIASINEKLAAGEKVDTYITVPSVVLAAAGIRAGEGSEPTRLSITPLTVHYDGSDVRVAVVPHSTGSGEIGFTNKAAELLKIDPQNTSTLLVKIKNGVLVLEKKA